jgi:hypothetical protein
MKKEMLKPIVLLCFVTIISSVHAIDFDPSTFISNYGIILDSLIANSTPLADPTTVSQLSACATKSQLAAQAVNSTAQLLIDNFPELSSFFDTSMLTTPYPFGK